MAKMEIWATDKLQTPLQPNNIHTLTVTHTFTGLSPHTITRYPNWMVPPETVSLNMA